MDPWSRRQFLAGWALLLGAGCGNSVVRSASVPAGPKPPARRAAKPKPPSIIVIGGGLAGLALGLELVELGHQVTVLEAQERPGGRILTIRAPFRDGLFVEAGALHMVGDPELLKLFSELGISLEQRRSAPGLARVVHFGGKRTAVQAQQRPLRLHPRSAEEDALGESGCMEKYFEVSRSFDPTAPLPAELHALDQVSGARFLRDAGASDGFVADMDDMLGLGDAGIERMSALSLVQEWAEILREIALGGAGFVVGGTDRVPFALARKLGGHLLLGAHVTAAEQSSTGVHVRFRRRGQDETLSADRVVFAVPAPVLKDVRIEPALSAAKRRALSELELESVSRVWVETGRRFWLTQGEAGRVDTELPLGPVRDESEGLPGDSGILGLYVKRAEAKRLAALSEEARLETALAHLERLQPGARAEFVAGTSHCWDADPFQRGAYAYFETGQLLGIGRELARAEGRFHFAGDHTSHRPGFLHGALSSARRAAREIVAASAV